MDHSSAHLMELTSAPLETKTIESNFTHEVREQSLEKGEKVMHHKQQHQLSAYYKELAEVIKKYADVILFGPTSAKVELFNILRSDDLFTKIRIDVQQTDKMTEHMEHAFVREYFSKH